MRGAHRFSRASSTKMGFDQLICEVCFSTFHCVYALCKCTAILVTLSVQMGIIAMSDHPADMDAPAEWLHRNFRPPKPVVLHGVMGCMNLGK